jgi:hypothetical protein
MNAKDLTVCSKDDDMIGCEDGIIVSLPTTNFGNWPQEKGKPL